MFSYDDQRYYDGRTNTMRRFLVMIIRLLGGDYHPRNLYTVLGGSEQDKVDHDDSGILWSGTYHDHVSDDKKKAIRWKHLIQQYGNVLLVKGGLAEKPKVFPYRAAGERILATIKPRILHGLPTSLNRAGTMSADFYLDALRENYKKDKAIQEITDPARRGKWTADELRQALRRVKTKIVIQDSRIFARSSPGVESRQKRRGSIP